MNPVNEATRILDRLEQGDRNAASELLPLVYNELRRVAASKLAREKPGQTLQPTALVHEAWLRLAGSDGQRWVSSRHFLAAAAEAMRRILIDRARKRHRARHGHGLERVSLNEVELAVDTDDETLLALDEALDRLAQDSPERAELVKLRYFVGLSLAQAGEALGISESTAKRQWNYIRARFFRELKQSGV